MSEAIKIKEGGVDRSQNQINKLKTNAVGGGVCFWVPETERQTDDKRITANGTYTAEDDGLYGYDEIEVSVPNTGSMSGKGTDGNDYSIDVDDNGYIVETKIPSYIKIITPPGKIDYEDGEIIDLTGIVVKAYDSEGNEMQTLTAGELTNTPLNADKSQASGGGSASYDGTEVEYTTTMHVTQYRTTNKGDVLYRQVELTAEEGVYLVWDNGWYACSKDPKRVWYEYGEGEYVPNPSGGYNELNREHRINSIDGTDMYMGWPEGKDWIDGSGWRVERTPDPRKTTGFFYPHNIEIVLAGERKEGGAQTITVTWYRTVDMKPLTDTFEIHVENTAETDG